MTQLYILLLFCVPLCIYGFVLICMAKAELKKEKHLATHKQGC